MVDPLQTTIREKAVEPTDRIFGRRAPGIREVEDAVAIEHQVVGAIERLPFEFVNEDRRLAIGDTKHAMDIVPLIRDVERAVPMKGEPSRDTAGVEEFQG